MAAIVPFAERRRRLPQAGRIRAGTTKPGKSRPQPVALDRFRFTAQRPDDLEIIAQRYGGQVRPWSDPKSEDRFEVMSEASEIAVVLPPDPLGDSPRYERWGGRGLERSCDGVTCEVPVQDRDGWATAERPCLCRQANRRECKPKIRLAVLLPEVTMRGTWRFDSGSDLAADELPGMVEFILHQQQQGLATAALRLEREQSRGGSHQFVVPRLGLRTSLEGLMAGAARLGAGDVPRAALGAPSPASGAEIGPVVGEQGPPPPAPPDDDVVDAVIVEERSELDTMLRMLNDSEVAELRDWWRRSGLPHRPDLTPQQEIQVAAQIKRIVAT